MDIFKNIDKNFLYFDGGTGTILQEWGLKPGEDPANWNLSHPDLITKLHEMYLDAGSDFVTTNTFGASPIKYGDSFENIIKAAVSNARKAVDNCGHGYVALDIGPTGKLLKPLGDLDFEDAVQSFAAQVKAGVGADVIIIETMNDCLETKAAVIAAKENSDLPIFVTNAYDAGGKLMTGASPEAMVAMLEGLRVDAIGINCSLGPAQMRTIVQRIVKSSSLPVIVNPNAGLPEFVDGQTHYNVSSLEFAEVMSEIAKDGAVILGGCCGTTPEYIKDLIKSTKELKPCPITDKNKTVVSSYTHVVEFDKKTILIGERINPTGKKAFKQALRDNNIDYILDEGTGQMEAGADILDVNVGLPEIDEVKVLSETVVELQSIINLPLQIDTTNIQAMEKALRVYNGKAMINSVNGKEESMEAIFPLASKYGGVVVALTLDENGIPETSEERLAIAEKIMSKAKQYGIKKKDIIIDTLAMAISSDTTSALTTLDSIKKVKAKGFKTSLGVSNISFGLPNRENINGVFFNMALDAGLDAAIINPYSQEMKKVYKSFMCLSGMDKNCADYLSFVSGTKDEAISQDKMTLSQAIIKGFKERAAILADNNAIDPMTIINEEIIPSLDCVGKDFETNKIYLPQLLMSAEAAKAAFEVLKKRIGKSATTKCAFVIATVKGDIHDIGKNIVKILLENYGFDVCDLGRDVPLKDVVAAVKRTKAPLVGLSALMTTTVPAMAETIKLLRKECPDVNIVVGGAVLTEEYAQMVGADKYCAEAMETVRYADAINSQFE